MPSPSPKPQFPVGITTPLPLPPIANPTVLAFPPVSQPMVNPASGIMTIAWQQWFQQAYVRMGGSSPINPKVPTQVLGDDYPYNALANGSAAVIYQNNVPFSPGAPIYFYISQLGTTTMIDSLTLQNNANTPGVVGIAVAPQGTLPPVITQINLPANSGVISIPQFTGFQMGSAAYLSITSNPSSFPPFAQQQIHCILKGRTIS